MSEDTEDIISEAYLADHYGKAAASHGEFDPDLDDRCQMLASQLWATRVAEKARSPKPVDWGMVWLSMGLGLIFGAAFAEWWMR